MCEQCGSRAATSPTEYGELCESCALRQAMHDEERATFKHLSPSMFGFDPYDDDPYD